MNPAARQETLHFIYSGSTKMHEHILKNLQLDSALTRLNPVHILSVHFFGVFLILSSNIIQITQMVPYL